MSRRKLRRRGRRAKRTRRPLTLTAWRAVIVGQAMQDLAKRGRLQALAALVLGARQEVRDYDYMLLLALHGEPQKAVRARLEQDRRYDLWRMAGEIFHPERAEEFRRLSYEELLRSQGFLS